MSKISTLVLALLFSITMIAAERPKSARLTIATYDNVSIWVEIDGRRFSDNDNAIRVNNINAGYHSIQVYRRTGYNNDRFGRNSEKLLYSNRLYVKPEHRVDIVIDRSGRARISEFDLGKKGRNDRRNDDRRNDDWGRNDNDGRWDDYDRWEDNNRGDDNWDNRNDHRANRPDRSHGRAVSYESFQSMKQTLRRESFDNSRITLAKQMMDRNYFETSQVKELLYLFSFESNRVDLAKYAYRNTVDKNNFHSLYDAFSFSSSKEELSRYISSYR